MCYFSASKIVVISENSIKKTTSYSLLFSIGVDLILFFLTSFCELLIFFSGVESLQFYFFWIFETEFLCNPWLSWNLFQDEVFQACILPNVTYTLMMII